MAGGEGEPTHPTPRSMVLTAGPAVLLQPNASWILDLLAIALAIEPCVGVCDRGVRLIRALLAVEIGFRVAADDAFRAEN